MPLHPFTQNLDFPFLVLGGMFALLTLAIALKLYRGAKPKIAKSLHNLSNGKSP
jgi:hypothetical protein